MNRLLLRLSVFALLLVLASACRHIDEPKNDADWVLRTSNTTSDLIISQLVSSDLGFFGGTNGTVLRTNDGGTNSMLVGNVPVSSESGTGVYGVHFFDATNGLAVGDGQSIWRTTNGGSYWSQTRINSSYNLRAIGFASPNVGIVGTADAYANPPGMNGELWRTQDGGITWNLVKSIYTGSFYNIEFTSATNGIATGKFGGAYYTNDAGMTWTEAMTDAPMYQLTHTTFINSQTAFAAALLINYTGAPPDSARILRTDDGGKNWHTIYTTNYGIQGIASSGDHIVAAGFNGAILESKNAGASWSKSTFGTERWLHVTHSASGRWMLIGHKGRIATRDDQ